ncbi:MAG: hypothetical protein H6963_00960 [Chromatiaceae bacterium]|nr:hypothetical protein [Chromatiaceae bacterium]
MPNNDEAVWQLQRRLQILVFDVTALGSASEALDKGEKSETVFQWLWMLWK